MAKHEEEGTYYSLHSQDTESLESLVASNYKKESRHNEQHSRGDKLLVLSSLMMFVLSVALLSISFMRIPSQLECARLVSPWSAMWEAVGFWEGELPNAFNHSSLYRGPPTAERETAWKNLWHYDGMPVTADGLAALNRTDPSEYIEVEGSDPAAPTYGNLVSVFHELHCLDLIRRYTWFLMGRYDPKDTTIEYPTGFIEPVGARMHVDHCFEALRQDIMCFGDITPVLVKYDAQHAVGRVADPTIHRKCRDFDRLVDWVKEKGVNVPFVKGTQ